MSGGSKPYQRSLNRSLVLHALRTTPGLCRRDLARSLGLDRSTISNIAAELMERGLVEEIRLSAGGEAVPAGSTVVPAGGEAVPAGSTVVPAGSAAVPAGGRESTAECGSGEAAGTVSRGRPPIGLRVPRYGSSDLATSVRWSDVVALLEEAV